MNTNTDRNRFCRCLGALLLGLWCVLAATSIARASGGGGGGNAETIKVSKCFYDAGGEMLVNASSSSPTARLFVYRTSGQYVCEVQNGGGSRYGGTVFYIGADPGAVVIVSSGGAAVTVPTTPFQL